MFGSGNTFGTPTSTFGGGGFGTTANAGGSVFGQPAQQQPTTSLFGGGGAGFGGQTTSLPAFGGGATTVSTGAFGAQPNTASVFGQPARPTTGIFNSTSNTMSPFSTQNTMTQVAGTSIPFNAITGTDTMMKNGAASQINTRHQCITCMKEYENKSLEELRLEDYQLNRKGPTNTMFGANPAATQQAQPGGGLFSGIPGASAAGTQPGATTFGQTSAFGQPAAASGGSLFSSMNQPKPGGFFGNTATPTSTGFGAAPSLGFSFSNPTSQPQSSIFGQNNNNPATSTTGLGTSSAFSFSAQPQQQQQGLSLFGHKPLTTPASSAPTFGGGFGSTATNTTLNKPMFGAATTATTFGAVSTANTFGTGSGSLFSTNTQQAKPFSFTTPFSSAAPASQPTFGGTSSTPTFSFSNPVSTPAVNFGTGTQPTFGGATGTTGVSSTFGAPISFSMGGTQSQAPAGGTGTSFGTSFFSGGTGNTTTVGAGTGLSLFGTAGTGGTLGTSFGAGGGLNLQPQQQLQHQQQQQQQSTITLATTPFKDNHIFYNLISNRKIDDLTKPTNPLAQRQYREASRRKTSSCTGGAPVSSGFNLSMAPAVKNLTFASSTKNSSISKFKLFDGFEDDDYGVGVDILSPKTDVKKLNLKNPDTILASPSMGSSDNGSIGMARRASLLAAGSPGMGSRANLQSPLTLNRRARLGLGASMNNSDLSFGGGVEGSPGTFGEPNRTLDFGESINESVGPNSILLSQSHNQSGSSDGGDGYVNGSGLNGTGRTSKRGSENDVPGSSFLNGGQSSGASSNACGVVCSRPQYYVKPSLEEMEKLMDANGNCVVKGLEIGRVNFGRIKFLEPVNIANIDIDAVVHFRHKEVVVYPDDKNKPELGRGLNVPSEIELQRVWPVDKATNELIRNPEEIQKMDYEAKLRKACNRTGSEFISYNRDSGTWKFKVPHFSKYSCDVEEDEDPVVATKAAAPPQVVGGLQQRGGLGGIPQQKLTQPRAGYSIAVEGGAGTSGTASVSTVRMALPAHYSAMMPPPPPAPLLDGAPPPPSDVELNPLTPCDSDDDDDDDMDDDDGDEDMDDRELVIRRPSARMSSQPLSAALSSPASQNKYKPILKDCGTDKSRLMKSVMCMEPLEEDSNIADSQPPVKKSRLPMFTSLTCSDESPVEGQHLKKRLSMIAGPRNSTPQSEQRKQPQMPSISSVEPVVLSEEPIEDMFDSLKSSYDTNPLKLCGSPRVCFMPNGAFLTVSQKPINSNGMFSGQVIVNQIASYAEKQEEGLLAISYRAVLERQMQDRFEKGSVIFREHQLALREQIRVTNAVPAKKQLEAELVIWELCDILWPGNRDMEDPDDEGFLLTQRKRLSSWLVRHAETLFGDQYDNKDKSVLGLMKKGLLDTASEIAMEQGNMCLSVMLQSTPDQLLDFSEDLEVLDGIPADMRDILALIAGNLSRLSWLNGDLVRAMSTYDWFLHFALYIWYEGPAKSYLPVNVDRAINEYEELMRTVAEKPDLPLPTNGNSSIANLAMHLLKLYSCTGYPMNIVLSPRTWSHDCLDYKLCWLLMRNLEEIGYPPGDELYQSISLGYTGMLEAIGKWKWCTFVQSQASVQEAEANEDNGGSYALRPSLVNWRILERNVGEGMIEEEIFLIETFGHPSLRYIQEFSFDLIKSWKSRLGSRRRPDDNMWYLGSLQQWQESYGVLTNYLESGLALDLIGNRVPAQATNIAKHLARLEQHKDRIVGWEVQGKMLTNYLKMSLATGDLEATEQAVLNFMESVIRFVPTNIYQCAFLLDMALSAQKMIQVLLAEPDITPEKTSIIEDNLIRFLEIKVPSEYFDGLRSFINVRLFNNTRPFQIEEDAGNASPVEESYARGRTNITAMEL